MSTVIRRAEQTDFDPVLQLLSRSNLTTSGLVEDAVLLLVATGADGVAACAAIEADGADALLRSVAVASSHRGSGLGTKLVANMEEEARTLGIQRLYLLTTTAEGFFEKLGYRRVERERVPDVVRASAEFSACSSAGATAMCRNL